MRTDFETNKIAKVLTILNNPFQAVNDSQLLDVLFEYKIPDVHEWYIMASKRAASLFNASLGIGDTVGRGVGARRPVVRGGGPPYRLLL